MEKVVSHPIGSHLGDGATTYGWYSCLNADQWAAESSPKNFTHNLIVFLRQQNVCCTHCFLILLPVSPFSHFPSSPLPHIPISPFPYFHVCIARPSQPSLPQSIPANPLHSLKPQSDPLTTLPSSSAAPFPSSPVTTTTPLIPSVLWENEMMQSSGQSQDMNPCTSAS